MIVNPFETIKAITIRRKLGRPAEFGRVHFGVSLFGVSSELAGIYQMRRVKVGEPTAGTEYKYKMRCVKEKFYRPVFEPSPECLATRQNFANAVAAWQVLTNEQKEVYNKRAIGRRMSGYNLFLREYLLS